MKVFAFLYNDCIFESSSRTMSLHRSRKGAVQALNKHKADAMADHELHVAELRAEHGEDYPLPNFGFDKRWDIGIFEILP